MKGKIDLLIAGMLLVGMAMAFPNTDFPSWDNHSPTQIDYATWQAGAVSALAADVPAFGSSWANATGLAKTASQTGKLFSLSYADTKVPAVKNMRIDPIAETASMTLSAAGNGLHEEKTVLVSGTPTTAVLGDTVIPMTQFEAAGMKINSTYETLAVGVTGGEANADGIWNAWAIAPSSSAAYVDDSMALSEAWSTSIGVADWKATTFPGNEFLGVKIS
jgi:hypothetical protein